MIRIGGINNQLVDTTVTWNGTDKTASVDVPLGNYNGGSLVMVDNATNQSLSIGFYYRTGASDFAQWAINSPSVSASTVAVYGPYQCFPRFQGGRIVLSAETAPANGSTTRVVVVEV